MKERKSPIKVICGWGQGPDVLLFIEPSEFVGLPKDMAIHLVKDLQEAIAKCEYYEEELSLCYDSTSELEECTTTGTSLFQLPS